MTNEEKVLVRDLIISSVNKGYYIQAFEMHRDEEETRSDKAESYKKNFEYYEAKVKHLQNKLGLDGIYEV